MILFLVGFVSGVIILILMMLTGLSVLLTKEEKEKAIPFIKEILNRK